MHETSRYDIEVLHLLNKGNFRIASPLRSDWRSRCDDVLEMSSSILEIKDPDIKKLEKVGKTNRLKIFRLFIVL